MLLGTGIDIIDIARIAEKIGKEAGFRELVFSPGEIAYCQKQAFPFEHYAARFAAKEAFFKALGTGWLKGTAFSEIVIFHNENGQPQIQLAAQTAVTLASWNITRIHVSLSHQKTIATAIVILEQ